MTEGESSESAARVAAREKRNAWLKTAFRGLLFFVGVGAVVGLVLDTGPDEVLATLLRSARWLPLVLALEAAWISFDVIAIRLLLGESARSVPLRVWARSAVVAYGVMVLLPAGRAGAEVARAAQLAPYVGGARAAALATRLQGATLFGNTLISIPCYVAVALADNAHSPLGYAVLGNGLVTAVLGGAIILAARRSKIGGWLGARIKFLASHGTSFDAALRDETPWAPPIMATFAGRMLQAVQYGVLLLAVGGTLTPISALVSQGIHLVGAGLGDMVPNQAGVTETAYRLFAPALGLADEPARALGIALVARICQYFLAGVSLIVGWLWKPATRAVPASS